MYPIKRTLRYIVLVCIIVELCAIIIFQLKYVPSIFWTHKSRVFSNARTLQDTVRSRVSLPASVRSREILPVMESDHWQPVAVTNDAFVFSAYIENGFQSAFFTCNITAPTDIPPASVSLVVGPQAQIILNILPVHDQTVLKHRFNLTACVCPIHSPNNKKNIVEWVETNRILGVELFTAFVYAISDSDMNILKHYKSIGIVEILNWTLSGKNSKPIISPLPNRFHSRGQLAALNDCLYRNKGRTSYTMATDLDELILPNGPSDKALVKLIQRQPKGDNGLYMFRHSYHDRSKHVNMSFHGADNVTALNNNINGFEHQNTAQEYNVNLNMLNNFARVQKVQIARARSKLIFRPEAVGTMGIHFAWEIREPYQQHVVDPDEALLHHYKFGPFKAEVEDRTADAYLVKVILKMNQTLDAIQKT